MSVHLESLPPSWHVDIAWPRGRKAMSIALSTQCFQHVLLVLVWIQCSPTTGRCHSYLPSVIESFSKNTSL